MISFSERNLKRIDILLLVFLPVIATIVALSLKLEFIVYTFLFFGLPAVWLSIRTVKMVARSLLFSVIFSIPLTALFDYLLVANRIWYVPETVFPFRLFNLTALEQFVWAFLFVYLVIIFYEHFFDKGRHKLMDNKMRYFIFPVAAIIFLFLVLLFTNPQSLRLPYAYLWIGLAFSIVPLISFFVLSSNALLKFVRTGGYFFFLATLNEFTGLKLGHWNFPGELVVGWVDLFGYRFPIEEFIFFFFLASSSVLAYYEFFDEKRKPIR